MYSDLQISFISWSTTKISPQEFFVLLFDFFKMILIYTFKYFLSRTFSFCMKIVNLLWNFFLGESYSVSWIKICKCIFCSPNTAFKEAILSPMCAFDTFIKTCLSSMILFLGPLFNFVHLYLCCYVVFSCSLYHSGSVI